ncbi:MAG: hypothetical protein ACOZNI_15975 [Myxococcota bacterium]
MNLPETTVVNDVAAGSERMYAAVSDLGVAWWDPAGSRGAEVYCVWDKFNAHGRAMDVPGQTGAGDDIAWLAMGSTEDTTGIFHTDDGGAT